MRKTKIICTIGPTSESEEAIRELILAGMNVSRHNFSHGDHPSHNRARNQEVAGSEAVLPSFFYLFIIQCRLIKGC